MRIASFGELLIDFVATENGVSVGEADGFQKKPGGAPANVAVAARRLGAEASFLGQVGDDEFGHYLRGVLDQEGVETSGLNMTAAARTMLAFVSLQENGERSFSFYRHPSADMLMEPADVAQAVIDAADVFHFGSITMIGSPAREATLAAAEYASAGGKLITYDPNLRLALWQDEAAARVGMRRGLDYAHVVKISDEEKDLVFEAGETVPDMFATFPQLQIILLTHGADGSHLHTRSGIVAAHEGFRVQSVDTTGAGDSFVAGSIVRLVEAGFSVDGANEHIDFEAVLRFANACGALATTQKGGIPGLPTREAVQSFLKA